MKLTRRKILYSLASSFVFVYLGGTIRKAKAQLSNYYESFKNDYDELRRKKTKFDPEDPPLFLYRRVRSKFIKNGDYPNNLKKKPSRSLASEIKVRDGFSAYPRVGKLPQELTNDSPALDFLHKDVTEACVCIGGFKNPNEFQVKWLGRKALRNAEFWSSTKIFILLKLVSQLSLRPRGINKGLNSYKITRDPRGIAEAITLSKYIEDVINYTEFSGINSNIISILLKRFFAPNEVEKWLKSITGNTTLKFQGHYTKDPRPFENLELFEEDRADKPVLVENKTEPYFLTGIDNKNVSAYDLTRMISMLGWREYLLPKSYPQNMMWRGKPFDELITALGSDPARFTDLAIEKLKYQTRLKSITVISKLGYGRSANDQDNIEKFQSVYTALVSFIDTEPRTETRTPKLFTFAMSLRILLNPNSESIYDQQRRLDATMAASVTDILERVVNGEIL